jgi:membrane-associated phospholipid phosphatase
VRSWLVRAGLTATMLLFLGLEYLAFVGTDAGRRMDTRAILDAATGRSWGFDRPAAASDLGHSLAAASFVLFAAGLLALSLRRRAFRRALATLAVVAVTAASAQLLKSLLGDANLLGGAERRIGASFPSGHATVAMSLGLALIRTVPPSWRSMAAVLAVVYASAFGVALILMGWHYPSDVAGGFLIAAAWGAAALPSHRSAVPRDPPSPRRPWRAARLAGSCLATLLLVGALGAGLVMPVLAVTHEAPERPLPVGLLDGVAALAACALVAAVTGLKASGASRAVRMA